MARFAGVKVDYDELGNDGSAQRLEVGSPARRRRNAGRRASGTSDSPGSRAFPQQVTVSTSQF